MRVVLRTEPMIHAFSVCETTVSSHLTVNLQNSSFFVWKERSLSTTDDGHSIKKQLELNHVRMTVRKLLIVVVAVSLDSQVRTEFQSDKNDDKPMTDKRAVDNNSLDFVWWHDGAKDEMYRFLDIYSNRSEDPFT